MNLLTILWFKGSRKVSFGVYVFFVANAFLALKLIQSNDWMACVAMSSALIGGGTWSDKKMEIEKLKAAAANGKSE